MAQWFGTIGAVLGAIGVSMGAFGSHGLRDKVEPRMLEVWVTATQYQLWHALALILVAFFASRQEVVSTSTQVAGVAFSAGVVIFSGSLFVLVLTGKTWLGAVTPIGGTALIIGWVAFAVSLAP